LKTIREPIPPTDLRECFGPIRAKAEFVKNQKCENVESANSVNACSIIAEQQLTVRARELISHGDSILDSNQNALCI
jgi:hypothetical protein